VSLRCYQINDDQIKEIAQSLETDTYVRSLDLSWNKIGDEGVNALVAALKVNRNLTYIGLCDNPITDQGYSALFQALQIGPPQLSIQTRGAYWGEILARQTLINRWPTCHADLPHSIRLPLNYLSAWSRRGSIPLPTEIIKQVCFYFLQEWVTEEHGCGIGPIIFGTDSYDSWVTEYGSSLSGSEEDESKWEWGDSQQEMKELGLVFRDKFWEAEKELGEKQIALAKANTQLTEQKEEIARLSVLAADLEKNSNAMLEEQKKEIARLVRENLQLQAQNRRLAEENANLSALLN